MFALRRCGAFMSAPRMACFAPQMRGLLPPARLYSAWPGLSQRDIDAAVARFERTLSTPDHTLITHERARRRYLLTPQQLGQLSTIMHQYGAITDGKFTQYWLPEVVAVALRTHGYTALVNSYRERLERTDQQDPAMYGVANAGAQEDVPRPTVRSIHDTVGLKSIRQAVLTHTAICSVKLAVWLTTGSAAIFADCMHSLADVINALYRFVGIYRAQRAPDLRQPYGYERQRFVFVDRSAYFLLFCGGVLPIHHSYMEFQETHSIVNPLAVISVFAVSAFLEFFALRKAYLEIADASRVKGITVRQFLFSGQEMMSVCTAVESALGIAGAAFGIVGVGLSVALGTSAPDAIAGMAIGSCVFLGAAFVLRQSEKNLLGATLPLDRVVSIVRKLEEDEV
eukprot:TRINITY_DN25609_c0_g1_i1.p1 TRINITY_DN25609_c0_g1~~TRINITY_DN25609_c0_g1_i1.p1  ORF type:complete len:397 (+),score=37.72 TRINITY_DN25609_c0_g1_i1:36-1226(+)